MDESPAGSIRNDIVEAIDIIPPSKKKRIRSNGGKAADVLIAEIAELGNLGLEIDLEQARRLMILVKALFELVCVSAGHDVRQITRLTTKLRDAGRRSPPWKAFSQRVPGRPQDGADGNRTNRWALSADHKFYADELTATLTEVKYYLQLLSMQHAPALPNNMIQDRFGWLIEHPVRPGEYLDPIQLIQIDFTQVMADAKVIQSGHLHPLDREGRHEPGNTFLMLYRSNQIQGNLTKEELIRFMEEVVERHATKHS